MNNSATTRAYAYLISDALVSLIHGVLPVILPIWLLNGMPADQYAVLLITEGAVYLVAVPLLSPAADRYGSARVLLVGEFCFAALLAMGFTLVSTNTNHILQWAIYFAASGFIRGLLFPAQATIIQSISPADGLERMLGWESIAMNMGRLTGPTIAALALATWTPAQALGWVLVFWLTTWLIQMAILFHIARSPLLSAPQQGEKTTLRVAAMKWIHDIRSGGRLRYELATERWLLIQAASELLFIVPAFGFGLALAVHYSNWHGSTLGWAQASCGAGILLANLAGNIACRRYDRWQVSQISGYGIGLSLLGMAAGLERQDLITVCIMGFAANFTLGIRIFCGRAQRRVALPQELQARFAAVHGVANTVAAQAGNALAAVVFQHISISGWYVLAGTAILPLTWATRRIPGWRDLIALSESEAQGFYKRRWPHVFNPELSLKRA